MLNEAKRLWDLGFAIIWLRPKSKVPVEGGWTTGPRAEWSYLEKTYRPGYNVGVRLGTPSKIGKNFLTVVDIDVKSKEKKHRIEAVRAAKKIVGDTLCPTVRSGRGGGSRHFYCLCSESFKTYNPAQSPEIIRVHQPSKKPSKKELEELSEADLKNGIRLSHAWEISLYSQGRQVVLPPSIHPDTGALYEWQEALRSVDSLPLLTFEGETVTQDAPKERPADSALLDFTVEPVELEWLPISKEVRDAIQVGAGVANRSDYLLKASSALISAGLSQNEVLTVLTDPTNYLGPCAYEHAKTKDRRRAAEWVYKYTFKKVHAERVEGVSVFNLGSFHPKKLSKEERAQQDKDFGEEVDWKQELIRNEKKKVTSSLKNLDLILTNRVEGSAFIEDLFASRIQYGANTPWGGKEGVYIRDIDMLLVKRWLSDTDRIEPSKDAILEATSLLAHRKRIHPVKDWLESLKWDGKKRISTWIKDYCEGVAEEPYLSEVSQKFLLAMVKRIFEPGCQWDYVLVLEGKQGKFKSSIARAIASDRWFMDNLPDLKDKDSMLNLQGKWLIELGELASVKRADYNQVKAYLIRRTDTVRPHYGRLQSDVPRQSVFIGTVNEGQYLKDPTGNRRYWPVKVGHCDVKALTKVREQLFAEAMHVYRTTKEILMLGPAATEQATEAQDSRRVDDDTTEMEGALRHFIDDPKTTFDFTKEFKARDLFVGVNAPWGPWAKERYSLNAAAIALRNLGFDRRKSHGQRVWYDPKKEEAKNRGHRGAPPFSVPPKSGAAGHRGAPAKSGRCPTNKECDFR